MLFGRPAPSELKPLEALAERLAQSISEPERAIGLNLVYDHRVSEVRALHFGRFLGSLPGGRGDVEYLLETLRRYRQDWIAKRPLDTFEHPQDNHDNHTGLEEDRELIHVCNVTQRLSHIDPAIRPLVPGIGLGNRAPTASEVNRKLRTIQGDSAREDQWIAHFLRLLRLNSEVSPWHPVWAAGVSEFDSVLSERDSPEAWMEAVGLQVPAEVTWLLVLRYPVKDAGRLYRPTVLEAGKSTWHFPSPVCSLPPMKGGHPINFGIGWLRGGRQALLSEYVHSEISFQPEHWVKGGRRLAATSGATAGPLMEHRRLHHALLCDVYGRAKVRKWMKEGTRREL